MRCAPLVSMYILAQAMAGPSAAEVTPLYFRVEVAQALTFHETKNVVTEAIFERVSNIYLIENDIDVQRPLTHRGVNSLIVVKTRNMLEPIEISVFNIM